MHRIRAVAASALLLSLGLTACTAPVPEPTATESTVPSPEATGGPVGEVFTPLIAYDLGGPEPAPSTDGRIHLAYELMLTNVLSQPARLDAIEVLGGDRTLLTLTGDELNAWIRLVGGPPAQRTVGDGQSMLVWLDVVVDTADEVPAQLTHRVSFHYDQAIPGVVENDMTQDIAWVDVRDSDPIVIGPPLVGPGWLNGNGCCTLTAHRGATNSVNGSMWAPERFAIDYVQLTDEGRFFTGNRTDLDAYAFYGADIIAVGDGPIVSMRSDLADQVPGANPVGLPIDAYGGNYIVQDLGGGHYAFYAHLQPGNPLGVQVGQQLKRGEVIGKLGNSGNSDAPHLHFHIMDSPLPLGSTGLPFLIDSFELAGRIASQAALDAAYEQGGPWVLDTANAGQRSNESPLVLDVMSYPDR